MRQGPQKGLKLPLTCNDTMTMGHNVIEAIFPGLPRALPPTLYLANKEELIKEGFSWIANLAAVGELVYLKDPVDCTGGDFRLRQIQSCL